MARKDSPRNFRYRLEIDAITQAGFSEVSICETAIDALGNHKGTDQRHGGKLPGLTKYANVTLKWGVTVDGATLDLLAWHQSVTAGQGLQQRRQVAIIVQDEVGQDIARFTVRDAWPIKYDPSELDAKGNEVFIEMLELVNEGIERVQ